MKMGRDQTTGPVVLLNIGNTHTQIAWVECGTIVKSRRVASATLGCRDLPEGLPVAVASVVPAVNARLKSLMPFFVSAAEAPVMDWSLVDAAKVGADRVANAVMLAADYPLPAMCFDFGTAITCEVVGAGPVFLGGSISPGRMLMRKALYDYTAQLPKVALSETAPAGLGTNTVAAMKIGIDGGALGMVRGLIEQFQAAVGCAGAVVAVGGDRQFFLRNLPQLIDGGDSFTLNGIYKIWENRRENAN